MVQKEWAWDRAASCRGVPDKQPLCTLSKVLRHPGRQVHQQGNCGERTVYMTSMPARLQALRSWCHLGRAASSDRHQWLVSGACTCQQGKELLAAPVLKHRNPTSTSAPEAPQDAVFIAPARAQL